MPKKQQDPATTDAGRAEPPGERPRIEVRTYTIDRKGKLEEITCYPVDFYGSCPVVGDTILSPNYANNDFYVYEVERRFFVEETPIFKGWALILKEVDSSGFPRQLWEEWHEASKFWDDVAEKEAEKYYARLLKETLRTADETASLPRNNK
ncbi:MULTISPECIES: hypothetical protein [Rhizobium]|uniref:Uncharacterized protein n=1 Tax=Rhizobium favelukesii TaxID=348824 RepID=W6RPP5_9HYPH|nr:MULTISPECIES: hypothetical protein [Rhizobium]MCS0462923.1 hypothetical protein [Rhizobium favelukesii]UFS82011.1 hypothetical protein LPB79_27640 [Rhizobium sp. T136]CDM56311.1 hypothetical protein LPU83_0629 [Rhizobium favelukesii]